MTRKKTAGAKTAGKKIKDIKLNKETVENLSDKAGKIKGGSPQTFPPCALSNQLMTCAARACAIGH